jgi:aerobic C4-dicarboxylate transport protein
MSEGLTPTNLIGNAVATIVVSKWEKALDEGQLHRVLDGEWKVALRKGEA